MSAAVVWSFVLCYVGFAALCLAMNRHHRQSFDRTPPPSLQRMLRLAGYASFAGALFACIAHWAVSIGIVVWLGVLSAAVLPLVFILPYSPRFAVLWAPLISLVVAVPTSLPL